MPRIEMPIWRENQKLLEIAAAAARTFLDAYTNEEKLREKIYFLSELDRGNFSSAVDKAREATLNALTSLDYAIETARSKHRDEPFKRPL